MSMTENVIRCRKTGVVLGLKMDGGYCVCNYPADEECRIDGKYGEMKLNHRLGSLSGG